MFREVVSRNSHSRAGYGISGPGQDYGHTYQALVLEFSAQDGLVLPYSCSRPDDDVAPRRTVVRMDGWEPYALTCAEAGIRPRGKRGKRTSVNENGGANESSGRERYPLSDCDATKSAESMAEWVGALEEWVGVLEEVQRNGTRDITWYSKVEYV
jgi:hypothetical protein